MMKKTLSLSQSRIITRDEGKWVGKRFITSKANWLAIAYKFQNTNFASGQRGKEEQLKC